MSNTERKRVLNYRNDNGLAPNPDNIDYGEIAIGYKKDNEAIYIKNTANGIVDFTPISIVNITYNKLKELRDNSKLKPSQYYRITDFVTTVANDEEARSAGHPFDLIILATDKNKLQEECYAIQHKGDTYFANCNLAAWKIWYCLDNDTTKYMWADTVNGKGVIYRMIDEWQNDCPYDFKNVQYKRYRVNDNSTNGELANLDGTYIGYNGAMTGLSIANNADFIWAYTFTHKDETFNDNGEVTNIDYIDYSIYPFEGPYKDDVGYLGCVEKGGCSYNIISRTYGSIGKDGQFYITAILNNIVLRNGYEATFNESDVPGETCQNTFSSANFNITLANNPEANHFGGNCYNIIAGLNFYANTFGDRCSSNSFGDGCNYNSFGDYCGSNSFGDYCGSNSFGNGCDSNSFGDSCNNNSFGNGCGSNSFGDYCEGNSFGNGCINNSFGGYCSVNSFGDQCNSNSFGKNFRFNTLGNDVQNIEITTEKIYHTHILNGTKGTNIKKLTIEFTPETTYSQFAGFTSDGVLKIWVEADDGTVDNTVDGGSY